MKTFIIVRKQDLMIMGNYQAMEKDDSSANRSQLVAEPLCAHLELPENLDKDLVKCDMVEGEMVLATDSAKVVARQNAAEQALRSQRDMLLKESDKYMMSDYPISNDNKALVLAYRQALRDLPENTEDPMSPVYPVDPMA